MARQIDRSFFEFWVQFREIVPYPDFEPNRDYLPTSPGTNIDWTPPECPKAFEIKETLPWHIWAPGGPDVLNQFHQAFPGDAFPRPDDKTWLPDYVQRYETASIFYSTALNNFLEVPYDCTQVHVSERASNYEQDGWNRFTFAKVKLSPSEYPNLWMIGHALKENQIDKSIYISDSWDDLLLPNCFYNGVYKRNTFPTCDLAGKLTMILGAVAFTTELSDLIPTVQTAFRSSGTTFYNPSWRTGRSRDRGLINQRGLIIDVAFEPAKTKENVIVDWEKGYYGPILTSNSSWPRPRPVEYTTDTNPRSTMFARSR